MRGSTIWGVLLLVIGVTILLRNVFDINLPLWDIVLPALLILWGVSMLVKNISKAKRPQ